MIERLFTWPEPGESERETQEARRIWREGRLLGWAASELARPADEWCQICGELLTVGDLFADRCHHCRAVLSHQTGEGYDELPF